MSEITHACCQAHLSSEEQPCWGGLEPLADPDWDGDGSTLKFACSGHRGTSYRDEPDFRSERMQEAVALVSEIPGELAGLAGLGTTNLQEMPLAPDSPRELDGVWNFKVANPPAETDLPMDKTSCHQAHLSNQDFPCWGRLEVLADPEWDGEDYSALKFACKAHRTSKYKAKPEIDNHLDYSAISNLNLLAPETLPAEVSFGIGFSGKEELAKLQAAAEVPEELRGVLENPLDDASSRAYQDWARRIAGAHYLNGAPKNTNGRDFDNLFLTPRAPVPSETTKALSAEIIGHLAQIEALKQKINSLRCMMAGFPPEFGIGMTDPCYEFLSVQDAKCYGALTTLAASAITREDIQANRDSRVSLGLPPVGFPSSESTGFSYSSSPEPIGHLPDLINVEVYVETPGRFRVREVQDHPKA